MRIFRPKIATLSDEQLCLRIRDDRGAFDALYDRYSQRLFQYLLRMLNGQRERAEDLLQEVFVQLYEHGDRFDPERRFATWLFAIAHHKVCNEYRASTVHNRAADQLPMPFTPPAVDELHEKSAFRA